MLQEKLNNRKRGTLLAVEAVGFKQRCFENAAKGRNELKKICATFQRQSRVENSNSDVFQAATSLSSEGNPGNCSKRRCPQGSKLGSFGWRYDDREDVTRASASCHFDIL